MKSIPLLKYLGIGITIIGVVLNIMMIVGLAWPTLLYLIIFSVGLILYGISKYFKNISIYLQIVIASIPFIISYILYDLNSASKDIFLIPNGFKGKVAIIYDQKDGINEEYEGKYRIYKIPENGILKTKFKVKGNSWNIGDAKYYYLKNNERISIKQYCLYCNDNDTINIQMIPGEGGNFTNNTQNITTHYLTFYIDIPNRNFKPDGKNIFQTLKIE